MGISYNDSGAVAIMKNSNFNPDPKKSPIQKGEPDFMATFNLAAFAQRVTLGLLPQKEFRIGVHRLAFAKIRISPSGLN